MVQEFVASAKNTGTSGVVRQMIMGAGKTTCITPLLGIMLPDPDTLTLNVVPPALLEFARAILRSTYSSVISKRVYTFAFERGTVPEAALELKLREAQRTSGIVVTTATAAKSLFLKFVELLHIIRDPAQPRETTFEAQAGVCSRVLRMFREGVCIMDEVCPADACLCASGLSLVNGVFHAGQP